MNKKLYSYDIEIYKNYYLIKFQNINTMQIRYLEVFNGIEKTDLPCTIKSFLQNENNTFVSFNGINFDAVMIDAYLKGYDTEQIKKICDYVISEGKPHWITRKKFKLREVVFDHIDLKEPAPGVGASLKLYGGRMGMPKLQELPIPPEKILTRKEADDISTYCDNDLETTTALYLSIEQQIQLRIELTEKYKIDLRSKSDAQMAAAIFKVYLEDKGVNVSKRTDKVKPFKFNMPDWVNFNSDVLMDMKKKVMDTTFMISDKGKLVLPKALVAPFEYDGSKYTMGLGGLHDKNKSHWYEMDDNHLMLELDGTSFYPSIIIDQGLYPKHLGMKFLPIYNELLKKRVHAKQIGDKVTDKTYKIILNGTFGLYSNIHSYLYSPELLLQITLSGQFSLMLLVEMMAEKGIKTVSSNTDGNVIILHKDKIEEMRNIAFDWELRTGLALEETFYKSMYMTNVNNYVAVTSKGDIKGKGTFADLGLMKNPSDFICTKAIKAFLSYCTPIKETIESGEITDYLTVRRVNGGAVWKGVEQGKVIRFYHSTKGESIHYVTNGNKVPKSDGCKPIMDLPDTVPGDIDYDWYIEQTKKLLLSMGYNTEYINK